MQVRVLFFGQLKDVTGEAQAALEVPEGTSVEQVFEQYADRFPRLRDLAPNIAMALNHEFASPGAVVSNGDEIAFLPPVSGGSGQHFTHMARSADGSHFFALTREPIAITELKESVLAPSDGALVVFEGAVRDNTKGRATKYLEYECYEAMAVKMMAEIGTAIADSHEIGRIAMVHRLGRMNVGETSVAIVVAAPHRKPAFEAALEGINRLKKVVPIWKKEFFVDGEVWVEGDWDESVLRQR